jgi:acyl-lipid Delta6-acetylenase / acyl-lipid (9-3)-desaturase
MSDGGVAEQSATADELAAAKTFVYRGRRYDVSRWLERHPGGADILTRFLDQDATCAMHMMHDMRHKGVQKVLQKLDRGPAEPGPVNAFDDDYLALEQTFLERGWFKPSLPWYAYKAVLVFALLAVAFVVPGPWLKGLFFGLFIQQSAFIAHDICHDAALPRRWRRSGAWLFGTVCFGLNHEKWQREHTIHHLVNGRPFEDPQMNTMPHLVYAERELALFEQRKARDFTDWERTKMGFQHIWLLPVLLLYGRINVVTGDVKRAWRARDKHFLSAYALHFGLWFALLAQGHREPLYHAAVFIPVTLAVSGLIHLQLILSHVYAPRLVESEQREVGMTLQAISNQNISTTVLDDWLHGGLQHHIEHHLFPRLPRHSLAKARRDVRALCEKHGLPYRSTPFIPAVCEMMRSLYRAGAPCRAELSARRRLRKA